MRRRSPLLPRPARLRSSSATCCSDISCFYHGLQFIFAFPAVGALLSQRILFLIFGFFFVMLVFSNLIIGYSTLFKNRETNWFLTLPIRHADIYRWKFLECVVVSSWALMFLSAPMMAAFGQVNTARPAFYFEIALIYLPFVAIPAVLGSMLVMLIVAVLVQTMGKKGGRHRRGRCRCWHGRLRAPGQRRRRSGLLGGPHLQPTPAPHPLQPQPLPAQRVDGARGVLLERRAGRARAGSFFACC